MCTFVCACARACVCVCVIWSQRVIELLKWPVSETELLSSLFPSPPEPLTPSKKENKIMEVWRKRESKSQVLTGSKRWECKCNPLFWVWISVKPRLQHMKLGDGSEGRGQISYFFFLLCVRIVEYILIYYNIIIYILYIYIFL